MSEHTKGPWKAEQTLGEWCITGQDRDDDPYSGTVVFSDAGVNGEANARLIAAAPDMEEAISLALDTPSVVALLDRFAPGILEVMRAAIAKARGGE